MMAVKIKQNETPKNYEHKPRFNFGNNSEQSERQTATIKELLVELNFENTKRRNGVESSKERPELSITSLETVLEFLREISGKSLRSVKEEHPIADIKTIKMLFNLNFDSGAHFIHFISPPNKERLQKKGKSKNEKGQQIILPQTIVDILTVPATPETQRLLSIKEHIISVLAKEISSEELEAISAISDPFQLRGDRCLYETNVVIDNILMANVNADDALIKEVDEYLTGKTRRFLMSMRPPLKRESRFHVATYTYLKLLDYFHLVQLEIFAQQEIPGDEGVKDMRIDFGRICRKVSDVNGAPIVGGSSFLSVEDVLGFVKNFASDVALLVSDAIGTVYNKRDVLNDAERAKYVLDMFLVYINLPSASNPKPVAIVHVIAAFCAVVHQRQRSSRLENTSRTFSKKMPFPQRQLDDYISGESKYILYTTKYLYLERMKWYVFALLGRKDKSDSHSVFQISQHELSRDLFMSLDHVQIREQMKVYKDFMKHATQYFFDERRWRSRRC